MIMFMPEVRSRESYHSGFQKRSVENAKMQDLLL